MKNVCRYILIFMLLFGIKGFVYAKEDLITNAKSGILIEFNSKQVLYQKNPDDQIAVASMTKMMAQIIILENIEEGNLAWDDIVTVSANAAGMGGSQIYLQVGEQMSVRDLFKGITMASANDAVVALAERIGGTEDNFVRMMNDKARELGLKNTVFVNPTGLDEKGHYSTASDMIIIASELLKHEEILEFSSVYEDYLRKDTPNKFWLVNTNKLVRFYDGADGLKTGFTDAAGYCMAVTAKRDDMRLVAVVFGEPSGKIRNQEMMELLDYGFDNYKVNLIKGKDDKIKTISIDKGNKASIDLYLRDDLSVLSRKSDVSINYDFDVIVNDVKLPIKKGDIVGTVELKENGNVLRKVDLISLEDVRKLNIFEYFINVLNNTLSL